MIARKTLLISGRENSGKTGLIVNIFEWLQSQKSFHVINNYTSSDYDVSALLRNANGTHILVHSATDDYDRLNDLKMAIDDCRRSAVDIDIILSSCRSPLHNDLRKSTLELLGYSSSADPIRLNSQADDILEIPLVRVLGYEGDDGKEWRDFHMLEVIKKLLEGYGLF